MRKNYANLKASNLCLSNRSCKGIMLTEAVLCLGIAGVLIGSVWLGASTVYKKNLVNRAVNDFNQMIVGYIQKVNFGQLKISYPNCPITDPPTAQVNISADKSLVNSGIVPTRLIFNRNGSTLIRFEAGSNASVIQFGHRTVCGIGTGISMGFDFDDVEKCQMFLGGVYDTLKRFNLTGFCVGGDPGTCNGGWRNPAEKSPVNLAPMMFTGMCNKAMSLSLSNTIYVGLVLRSPFSN